MRVYGNGFKNSEENGFMRGGFMGTGDGFNSG